MKLIRPSCSILLTDISSIDMLKRIEKIGRVCYKSEDKITDTSYIKFIQMILSKGHESVLEHGIVTCNIICDRAIANELVRHRIASYSQESTRYCNYSNKDMEFIIPEWCDISEGLYTSISELEIGNKAIKTECERLWAKHCLYTESIYNIMISDGCSAQQARSVLINSLKTELYITTNLREWRHIFKLRLDKSAHPQMREIMRLIFKQMYNKIPFIFEDLKNLVQE